jgi:tetratricopeptide (TPR) repeat protein
MQLAAAYQQGEQMNKAIAVLELMEQRGALNREQIINLARMYLANDVPYKAAYMLERQMQAGALARNREHLLLLADSLLLAQDRARSAEVLNELINLAADGELYHRLGRIYFDLQQWPQAMAALQSALNTEGLRDAATANLLLGIAAVHANQQALAERSLALAADSMGTRAQALWWLQRLQREHQPQDAESGPEG